MATLSEVRDKARIDLKDIEAADYEWTDPELDRHILHAVSDYSRKCPDEKKETGLKLPADSRDIDVSSLTGRIEIVHIEYPVNADEQSLRTFEVWGNTVTLEIDEKPEAESDVHIWWTKVHTLDGSGTTIPDAHIDLVIDGAVAHAMVSWGRFAANQVNIGDPDVARKYLTLANFKLQKFVSDLNELEKIRESQRYSSETVEVST